MRIRTSYVSNSSSSSFIIRCDNKKHLEYMKEELNNYLDAFQRISPFVDSRYELKENYIECFTCDGDYIAQDVLEKLQEHLYYYGMVDEDGDSIDFTTERIYNG